MDNHFNTPAEVIDLSIKACENKTRLPLGKMILLGIMAGAFIAFGGATSSTAAHAVENVGVARALAGCIFHFWCVVSISELCVCVRRWLILRAKYVTVTTMLRSYEKRCTE